MDVAFLVLETDGERFLEIGYGLGILLQLKMALTVDIVIDRPLMRGEGIQFGDGFVEIPACRLIIPFIVATDPHVAVVTRVEVISLIQLFEQQQGLMVFPTLEILQRHSQTFAVVGWMGYERQRKGGGQKGGP